jgi:hypothetical protein
VSYTGPKDRLSDTRRQDLRSDNQTPNYHLPLTVDLCPLLEDFSVVDMAAQRLHRAVPRLIHHLEDRGATLGGAGQKPGAHRVPRKQRGIEPDALGIGFHDIGRYQGIADIE